ncbi:MAG: cell wall anchor protein, partial [Rhizobiaceae bacterium]|nr:cell wall anchor protein [Rhizobiaceae bacterium]
IRGDLETAHAAFIALSVSADIRKATIIKEAAAYASTRTVCLNPENINVADAVVLAAQAYAAIKSASQQSPATK